MKRRDFLRDAALAAGGLTLSFRLVGAEFVARKVEAGDAELGDFLTITPSGEVVFKVVKHEMGQGVATSLPQILCEELAADWARVRVEFPLADMARWQNDRNGGHDTGGSCTITYQYDLLRRAGATAREMLVAAAAGEWGVPAESCRAVHHEVVHGASGRRLGFGHLAAAAAKLPVPDHVLLKPTRDQTLIGTAKRHKLVPDIVAGALQYGIDVMLPGMKVALIERCPVFKGKLRRFDARKALAVPGVRKVFATTPIAGHYEPPYMPHDIRDGVAVVADSFWAAKKGREALVVEWDEGEKARWSTADFEKLAAERARHRQDPTGFVGDENAVADLARVRRTLRASYVYPHQVHSCMEPLNCTAHVTAQGCEIWCGSQAPNLIVDEVAKLLKIGPDRVRVHLHPSGGGFGRRYYPDFAVEAAFISREAGNVPVKMMWTREDDQTVNLVHLFQHMEYQAAIGDGERLYAWYEKELRSYTWGATYANPELPQMAYDIPNLRYDFEDLIDAELAHSSAWRGVVMHGKCLSECFLDEVAIDLKRDPLNFRLDLLTPGRVITVNPDLKLETDRFRRVLQLAAEKAGWGAPLAAGRGRGICLSPYNQTCVCCIAEVEVKDGDLKIVRIVVAVDCGRLVNPLGAANQVEGGIVWGLTGLLYGGFPVKDGCAVHRSFVDNKLLRMHECPRIDVFFTGGDADRPWGIGEVSTPVAAPAVLNAIFAATGKRIRKLPLEGVTFA
ncbi:MAG TPA: molybdopterin cofactor-binding domain-containing protein [Steroidobacteraceae bacterium]|nr:molybdopterin cofactor-binding domain-containing protein [Steroidobacteraceae bacterium]